jgi:hypothetical protein
MSGAIPPLCHASSWFKRRDNCIFPFIVSVLFCFILFLYSIIQCCHVVFFKQLSSWLLYGQLIDQYAEFFVCRASDTQGTSTSTTLDSFSSQDINEMLSMVCYVCSVCMLLIMQIVVTVLPQKSCCCYCSYSWVIFCLNTRWFKYDTQFVPVIFEPPCIMCGIWGGIDFSCGFTLQWIMSVHWCWLDGYLWYCTSWCTNSKCNLTTTTAFLILKFGICFLLFCRVFQNFVICTVLRLL